MTTATTLIQLRQRADEFLDSDAQQTAMRKLGQELFDVFGSDEKGRVSTQVRNLQQMAVSAARFADVEDFVKNQMGKEKADSSGNLKWHKIGDQILKALQRLRDEAGKIAADDAQRLQVRLHLVRGWIRAVVGSYMYAKACSELKR
jgi:hypothetical protein